MTGREAMEGFQNLSRKFGKAYKGDVLNQVWPELLGCHHTAFVRAIGIMLKNSKYLPEPEYVLEQTRWWQLNMSHRIELDSQTTEKYDPDAEGREALANLLAWMERSITREEYIYRLYAMSEKYKKPGYAQEAARHSRQLKKEEEKTAC